MFVCTGAAVLCILGCDDCMYGASAVDCYADVDMHIDEIRLQALTPISFCLLNNSLIKWLDSYI